MNVPKSKKKDLFFNSIMTSESFSKLALCLLDQTLLYLVSRSVPFFSLYPVLVS